MDPSFVSLANIPVLNPAAEGLAPVLAVAGIAAGAAFGVAGGVSVAGVLAGGRRRALWRRVGLELGLRLESASEGAPASLSAPLAAPILRGIRHGRAVEAMLLSSGLAQIAVRVANPRRLLDQIPTSDQVALAGASWLTPGHRQELSALGDRRHLGSIAVRGSFVTLTAPIGGVKESDPGPLRALFLLAHHIAETVDSTSGAITAPAPPQRTRRRFGPGVIAMMSHRRV